MSELRLGGLGGLDGWAGREGPDGREEFDVGHGVAESDRSGVEPGAAGAVGAAGVIGVIGVIGADVAGGSSGPHPPPDAMSSPALQASHDLVASLEPASRPGEHGPSGASPTSAPRRGAVDPVKALMHRHRDLCERAVDPLEIAAGLEAHGVTDRTAARFRHRDVFSLAEEMYARVSRDGEEVSEREPVPNAPGARGGWAVLALLPGALCAAAVIGVRLTDGRPRLAVAAAGALAVALALRVALDRGPLRAPSDATGRTRVWTCWLVAYALLGDGLLAAGLDDGPHGPWPLAVAPVLALGLSCAPAVWCAQLLATGARRKLASSRGLAEFADSVKPLILGVFALHLCVLAALLALCAEVLHEPSGHAGAGALGELLLLARLLIAHGTPQVPVVALRAAALAEALALGTVFASRLPGCSFLAVPVRAVVDAWGAGAVPALVCGTAALVLLVHATRTLTRASAHSLPSGAT
ncbi:hypothetical protein QBA57_12630 [Streptomyces scabiei]|uniref:hypothetical protein n=3 Tax=Streptomyces scabiei TaxID=1930 RepID=UPI001B300F07|nr:MULTISPECIES: hypothetical protein [Streptomyces]MBP5861255.1 hypothetical protein [Streptomyces sp. LBUM 1484]MBP5878311.1 hypothetical protein [Streptomyces sp. LBUM 1477]MBP5902131.1 hypothetical protein [Streptomyces sp. LBUM 1488]MDW8475697.1 hypothetical protein [Streptomyces scabiei]MDX3169764.1 hypothetical protein [Streptomyces scabiei]